jgi:hypothetical protein
MVGSYATASLFSRLAILSSKAAALNLDPAIAELILFLQKNRH